MFETTGVQHNCNAILLCFLIYPTRSTQFALINFYFIVQAAERRVALVLVDRGLDLATACSLDTSACLLDRVLNVLPRFSGHTTERAVDMSPLCSAFP
jgi:hypothetical protein